MSYVSNEIRYQRIIDIMDKTIDITGTTRPINHPAVI